jgi:membrane-associated phospholipid phosphatase
MGDFAVGERKNTYTEDAEGTEITGGGSPKIGGRAREIGIPGMSRVPRSEYRKRGYAIAVRENILQRGDSAGAEELEGSGFGDLVRKEWGAVWAACGMFEFVALAYLGVSSALILLFAENSAYPARLLGMQAVVAAVILVLCRLEARVAERAPAGEEESKATDRNVSPTLTQKFWHFWRHWYPHLYFLFCFEEMGRLVRLVQPEWQDAKLIAFDHWLTGVNPSLWLERFAHPALNEFMQFAYFSYFLFLLILGAILYHRRAWGSYWAVMTYSAIGYSLGYIIATLFPVQSPWFAFAGMWHGELAGGPFTAVIHLIERCGRVHGAAFPSQHVAGAMAALWGAWRHRRWLFWVFLPFVACMCVSTVYVRNHYVADVLGGLVTGTLGYLIGRWLIGLRPGGAGLRSTD